MLALSAFHALRDAVASVADYRVAPRARRAGDRRAHPVRGRGRFAQRARRAWLTGCAELAALPGARRPRGARRRSRTRSGSTPREAGTTMIVGARDACGTIGGGHLEFEAIRIARDALARAPCRRGVARALSARRAPRPVLRRRRDAGVPASSMRDRAPWLDAAASCAAHGDADGARHAHRRRGRREARSSLVTADHATGSLGDARARFRRGRAGAAARRRREPPGAVLVDAGDGHARCSSTIVPSDFNVLVFGNGHVGRALVQVLGALPARVRWIDSREHDFPASVPANVEIVATDAPEAELAARARGVVSSVDRDAQPRARLRHRRRGARARRLALPRAHRLEGQAQPVREAAGRARRRGRVRPRHVSDRRLGRTRHPQQGARCHRRRASPRRSSRCASVRRAVRARSASSLQRATRP